MACCSDNVCSCIVQGDGVTASVAGVGSAISPYVITIFNPAGPAVFYPETYGPVTGDATMPVRAALAAAIAADGVLQFQEGKTYVTDMLSVTGACSIYIPSTTTVKLKDSGTEVGGLLTVFTISASNVSLVCKGWIDANRAGQNQSAFNAAGGSNGGKYYFGVRVQTGGAPLTNVVVDARIKNSADKAFSAYKVGTGCEFTIHATTSGGGADVSDSSDFNVPLMDLWSLDNVGWKVYPHAFDLTRCVRPQIGIVTVRDHFGTGTVAGGTALSDWVSGLTFVDVQDGVFRSLSVATRPDVTMSKSLGISWLSVRRCTLNSFDVLGYSDLGFEVGAVVDCQVSNGVIDGRYQIGVGSPTGRGMSIYNNGYYPDFLGRSQRFSESNEFTNIRIMRCMGEGVYQSAGRFNTFTNVSASGCLVGIRQEFDPTTFGGSFPGQSFVDLEGNTFIGCEFSYNERYGAKFVDARSAKLIGCRSNNNGQSLNTGPGITRQGSFSVFDTAGLNFATSTATGSVKSGIVLVGCESIDDQTWAETVSFNPANPTVIYPNTTGRYHVGQTINLYGGGPGGVAANFYSRINSIEFDVVTLSDPLVVSTTIAGTGTIATTSVAVTGTGSTFKSELRGRFFIVAGGQTRQVAAVTDDTHMSVTTTFSPDLVAGTTFTIYKTACFAAQSQKYGAEFSADCITPQVTGGAWTGNVTAPFLGSTLQTFQLAPDAGPDPIPAGESSMDRAELNSTTVNTGTGSLRGRFFTARTATPVSQIKMYSGTTAAGATPTLVRVGVWTATAAGALVTLVGSTPNDTTLLAAASTAYTKALSATFTLVPGQRYFAGLLVVTAAAAPTMMGNATVGGSSLVSGAPPMMAGLIGSNADLPASGTASGSGLAPYIELLP